MPNGGSLFDTRLSFAQLSAIVEAFTSVGMRKLRITGGEPLLRKDLASWIADLPSIDDVAMTTNGSLLAAHARRLRDAGLHRLTVSLDSMDPDQFNALSGGRGILADVVRGLLTARDAGFADIKLNAVIQRGVNEDQILPLARFARENGFTIRYIEFMDVGTHNHWSFADVIPAQFIVDVLAAEFGAHPLTPTVVGEVAQRYAYGDSAGEFGVIASVTQPFCGDCNRARVSAEGMLYTCLFAGQGTPLLPVVDEPGLLRERIREIWNARSDRYSEQRFELAHSGARKRVEMFLVGG